MRAAEGAPSDVYSTVERAGGEGEGSAAGGAAGPQGAPATLHVTNTLHVTKNISKHVNVTSIVSTLWTALDSYRIISSCICS